MKTILFALTASTMLFVSAPERHRTLEQQYATTPAQKIELTGFSGSRLKVRCWDKNEISIRLDISFEASEERDEQKYLDAIALKARESKEQIRIEYFEPEMSLRNNRSVWTWLKSVFSGSYTRKEIEGEIFVPRSNTLTADVRYGSIDMDGMKGGFSLQGTGNTVVMKNCSAVGEVTNDYGKVTLENCGGALRLSSKSTTVLIDQFDGKVSIDADYSNITVRDVSEPLTIHSTSGTIKVDRIGGDATIRSDYSNITANSIGGVLEILDKSGKIRVRTVGGVKIDGEYSSMEISDVSGKSGKPITLSGQSGPISLSNAVGDVQIDNPYGTIELKEIKGNVEIKAKSSNVRATGISGDWTSTTEYCTLSLRDLSAKRVIMSNMSGQIDVDLKVAPSTVDIRNEYAKVNLEMPTGFSGDVDLNVTYGHIETNLPLSKTKSFDGGGGYAMGKMGNGNGKISVETKSGNVKVTQR
jgi:DUF4097 and DUF4098 domain-containing protein YvlB